MGTLTLVGAALAAGTAISWAALSRSARKKRDEDADLRQHDEDVGRNAVTLARQKEMEATRRQQQADEEAVRDMNRRVLQDSTNSLIGAYNGALTRLPFTLADANSALEQADQLFREGAFSPFWAAVEKAVTCLARYDKDIGTITTNATRIAEAMTKLAPTNDGRLQASLSRGSIPPALSTIQKMERIVHKAQRDIRFATIYEQRRTNGILVAGFANLGCALDALGSQIQASLQNLAASIDSSLSLLAQRGEDSMSEITTRLKAVHAQLETDSTGRRKHEQSVESMLDNIQRHRKPID